MFPRRPTRRSQLISPFGIGAMVSYPRDESLMPAGLDAWPNAGDDCPADVGWKINEERLQVRLGVSHFRQPPEFKTDSHDPSCVPCVRFPRWHYCPKCGGMEFLPSTAPSQERCKGRQFAQQSCHALSDNRRQRLIPVRFITVCERGHVEDFPFMEWTHGDQLIGPDCRLRFRAGRSSAGLGGITVDCSCGASSSLAHVFREGALDKVGCACQGLRPWLGDTAPDRRGGILVRSGEGCGLSLRIVQRGASNVYFSHVVSAIYLPLWAEHAGRGVIEALEDPQVWNHLRNGLENGCIDLARCESVISLRYPGLISEELRAAAQRRLEGQAEATSGSLAHASEEEFRRIEYTAISEARGDSSSELFITAPAREEYGDAVSHFCSGIRLAHKLRETRVLAGFTRLLPPDGDLNSARLQKLKLSELVTWLPAIKVYGEGVFLELDEDRIAAWVSEEPEVGKRVQRLVANHNAARLRRLQAPRALNPKFVLLHTLAHVLITQLSFDCGYGSASLRERIYCDTKNSAAPMSGVLIYTASGDAEGSLGGLVRQGRPSLLEATFLRAIQRAAWCSSDPVCIESTGQGSDNANLAACHGCALLPETSCEEGNRLLDRALLVGTPDHPTLGFFRSLL
jgi:hypothetical protein